MNVRSAIAFFLCLGAFATAPDLASAQSLNCTEKPPVCTAQSGAALAECCRVRAVRIKGRSAPAANACVLPRPMMESMRDACVSAKGAWNG